MKNTLRWFVLGAALVPTVTFAYDWPVITKAGEDIHKQYDWLQEMLTKFGPDEACGDSFDIVWDHSGKMFDLYLDGAQGFVDIGCSGDLCLEDYLDYKGAAELYLKHRNSLLEISNKCLSRYDTTPTYVPSSTVNKSSSSKKSSFSKSSSSSKKGDVNCGEHGYYSAVSGCRCDNGYKRSGGSCIFKGCPSGMKQTSSGVCEKSVNAKVKSKRVQCTAKNPCVCPTGYLPQGNKVCIPK